MGSNPIIGTIESAIFIGKIVNTHDLIDREWSRKKTHETTAYLPSIRQVEGLVASGAEQGRELIIQQPKQKNRGFESHPFRHSTYYLWISAVRGGLAEQE
jgi:hypothetical protein